jgi:hypothetical protein
MRHSLTAVLVLLGLAGPAAALQPVELELLLAVDVSHSIGPEERALQLEGIARAFRDPRLIEAVAGLPGDGMAVTVMIWAGQDQQRVLLPWQRVHAPADCLRFADDLMAADATPWPGVTYTAIGSALLQGARELAGNGFAGSRLVIDVSGDDPGNQGPPAEEARTKVVAQGVVVNGLPVLTNRIEHEDRAALVRYYRDKVAGGPGAFVLAAQSFADFRQAMRDKLILEIAGRPSAPAAGWAGSAPSRAPGDS